MDEVRIHPETLAGDPFVAAGMHDSPHACNDGWASMGVESEEGETEYVLYLCRRCSESGAEAKEGK
jgi:hypothetical protein